MSLVVQALIAIPSSSSTRSRFSLPHRCVLSLSFRHLPADIPFTGGRRLPELRRSSSSPFRVLWRFADGGDLLRDVAATGLSLAGAYSLVLVMDNLTRKQVIEQRLSRKLVHILSGLLFMGFWPVFSTSAAARYFASFVPLVNCLRLLVHGLLIATDGLVQSVTREGRPEELLRGPLYYVLVLFACTLAFWRDSPIGIISLSMMCAGDGMADIMGRKFGSLKIPYNQEKSWAGSISMFICGFLVSLGMLYYFSLLGYYRLDWFPSVGRVALVSMVATMVESLSTTEVVDDNISVPLASMMSAYSIFLYY